MNYSDMNRIIAIYGHSDCGKTETLNYLRELLLENGGRSLSGNSPLSGDVPEAFRFNNQIVCVCPGGDTADVVRSNFDFAYSSNADIIVTASRTRGGSVDVINEEGEKNGILIEWMQKSYENYLSRETQMMCNKEYAGVVMGML